MNWFVSSLLAAVLLAAHFLFFKQAHSLKLPVAQIAMFAWSIAAAGLLLYHLIGRQGFAINSKQAALTIVMAGLTFFIGSLLLNKAMVMAPNPGFATAVGSLQVLLLVVASVFIFGSSFSGLQVMGASLVVAGVILLGL